MTLKRENHKRLSVSLSIADRKRKLRLGLAAYVTKHLLTLRIYYSFVAAITLYRHAYNKTHFKPGVGVYTCNASIQESETGESQI